MNRLETTRSWGRLASFASSILVAAACTTVVPTAEPHAATAVPTGSPATMPATTNEVAPGPGESFASISIGDLPRNGRIVFVRTDDSREVNTTFLIDPNGSNEARHPDKGLTPGIWSPGGRELAVGHFVKDPNPTPGAQTAWMRPALVVREFGWWPLDPAPGRKMHLFPIGWSADGSLIFLHSGGEDVDPNDMGIYTMRESDGGDLTHLYTTPPGHGEGFVQSPDHTKFLGTTSTTDFDRALFVIDADGSERVTITGTNLNAVDLEFYDGISASWSPDGAHIVFGAQTQGSGDPPALYVVRADGTNLRQIVGSAIGAVSAQWSPTGDAIAFTSKLRAGGQVWVVAPDGTGLRQLTDGADGSSSIVPMWSPDGQALVFQRKRDDEVTLWTMHRDGSVQRQLAAKPLAVNYVGGYAWWPAF